MRKAILLFPFLLLALASYSQAYKIEPIVGDSSMFLSPIKIISNIQIIGNKTTKPQIIKRELAFNLGDTLTNTAFVAALEQSKKNLYNTSLFNFVKIDWAIMEPNKAFIIIQLQERWYTFPVPIFEIDDNNFNTWWQDKDFSRINYGLQLIQYNFRGRKEKLSITAQFGFTERLKLNYDIPYINKNQKSGLGFSFSYNRRDEIAYTSEKNKRLQYKSTDDDAVRNLSSGITYTFRPKIFSTHRIGLEYDFNEIKDTVRQLNPNYLGENQREKEFFSIYYSFTHDHRDSKNYPLSGSYFQFSLRKYGLGIFNSKINLLNFQLQAKKFIPLGGKFFFAAGTRAILAANNNQPYLLQNGLGYSPSFSLRSYEYYVIDGQNIGIAKTEFKFQLIKPRIAEMGFFPIQKFKKLHYALYGGIFSDFGYVQDNTGYKGNNLANEIQYGYGIGLDFVTYYDIVIRSEFSFNKFGESGFFLHFVAPI